MKFYISLILMLYPLAVLGQLSDREIYDAKGGRIKNDTSYVYWLPYEEGKRFFPIQAANSKMSHKNELSFDFKMKKGNNICAVRDGIVIDLRSDSDRGGLKEENLSDGNFIIVRHRDGSLAKYWHLEQNGVFVKMGDHVNKAQIIGKSGNTGYSAFPHLHFQVVDATGKQILPRFLTKKGKIYLRPGRKHKCIHHPSHNLSSLQ